MQIHKSWIFLNMMTSSKYFEVFLDLAGIQQWSFRTFFLGSGFAKRKCLWPLNQGIQDKIQSQPTILACPWSDSAGCLSKTIHQCLGMCQKMFECWPVLISSNSYRSANSHGSILLHQVPAKQNIEKQTEIR